LRGKKEDANILVIVMVLAGIAIIVDGHSMNWPAAAITSPRAPSVWNDALPVAEAGIEEALTQIQLLHTTGNGWS